MMMRRLAIPVAAAMLATFLAGCGGGVEKAKARREVPGITDGLAPVAKVQDEATAADMNYQGWAAYRLTNGMVTVVVVPEAGGRIVEYKLGGHPCLWVESAGSAEGREERQAAGPQNPLGSSGGVAMAVGKTLPDLTATNTPGLALTTAKWSGRITVARGRTAEVVLTSPEDKDTGLQLTRTVQLFGGSSQLRVTDKLTNVRARAAEWAVAQVTRVPGSLQSGERFSDKSRLYLPLSPDSRFEGGFRLRDAGGGGQFQALTPLLLQVAYQGQEGSALSDSAGGWVAHVDGVHNYALVQRYPVSKLGDYPEQGVRAVLRAVGAQPCLEITLLSVVRNLQSGDSVELTTDWFATRVGGPIRDCTEVAALREPLKLERKEGKLRLTGLLGVFAPGNVALIQQDGGGQALGQPVLLKVSPADEVKLDKELPEESTARKLVVELQNDAGTPLGIIGALDMGATVARASAPADK